MESIRRFPDQETCAAMIRTSGFEQVSYRKPLDGDSRRSAFGVEDLS